MSLSRQAKTSLLLPMVAVLSACGGGGDASTATTAATPETPSTQATPATLNGVVATGAAVASASVQVRDSRGLLVCSTTTDALGAYSCTLDKAAVAPLAVQARKEEQLLVSVAAAAATGTVNITPLTTLVAARLVPSGDPADLASAIQQAPTIAAADKVAASVSEIQNMLAPVLGALNDNTNPITGKFSADGTGHDKVLDAIQIAIQPAGTVSNIEVTVKTRPTDDTAQPVSVSFKSNAAEVPAVTQAIRSEDLMGSGIGAQLNDFMARATACYALPLKSRVSGVADGATAVTGGASVVQAEACRGLFVDNDPASFKDNGVAVGSSGAFSGLFREASTATIFDRPNLEYQFANGDMMVTFRATGSTGIPSPQSMVLRVQAGKLKAIGNQYQYDASVRAFATKRDLIFQPEYSWLGTGYNISIQNRLDPATRLPLFKEVRVTGPDGAMTVYRPVASKSTLTVVWPDGKNRGNQVLTMAAAYESGSTKGHPSDIEAPVYGAYFTPVQRSEDELRALPNQGVWSLEFVHADTSRANVTQTYRTISRALTPGEVRALKVASLSDGFRAQLLADATLRTNRRFTFGAPSQAAPNVYRLAAADGSAAWTVPDESLAPTSIGIFGGYAGLSWSNSAGVRPADRTAQVTCTLASANDTHCTSQTGVLQFAEGASVSSFEFWTRTLRHIEVQRFNVLYAVTPPAN